MNSIKLLALFVCLPLQNIDTIAHEYYVSVTEMTYVEEKQSLQIISQIFIDDFETVLRKRYDETITLDSKNESEKVEIYMERYLSDKLNIKLNGSKINFKYIGKEYRDDITYCYLEIENVSKIESLEVRNQILFDAFSDQQNIVRMKLLNKNKSFLLVPDNDTFTLNFK